MNTALNESVADRIEALLTRVDGVRRGSDCPRPTMFDRRGERHARAVACRDLKPVDTGLAAGEITGKHSANAADSCLNEAGLVPVTGASRRLSNGKAPAR